MTSRGFELTAWILFILSAFGFIGSSLRSGDLLSLVGGILFLAGCILFVIRLIQRPA